MKSTRSTHKQSFVFHAPGAARVYLAADFTDWQKRAIPLEKKSDGSWIASVSLKPGTYRYRYLVDGNWCDDPKCQEHVANPFGSQDGVLVVGDGAQSQSVPHVSAEL